MSRLLISLRSRQALRTVCVILLSALLICTLSACSQKRALREEGEKEESGAAKASRTSQLPDPWPTVQKVIGLLRADNTQELLAHIYPMALDRYGREQIIDRNARIHSDLAIRAIDFSQVSQLEAGEDDHQLFYDCEVRYQSDFGEIKGKSKLSFIWHPAAKAWQLDWTPAVILPGLNENGQVRIETLPAERGAIMDRAGWPLAVNTKVARVSLVPRDFDLNRKAEAEEMLGLLPGTIESKLAQSWVQDDSLVPIASLPSLKELDYRKLKELGLLWEEKPSRLYPFAEATAALVGYVGPVSAEDLQKEENRGLTAEDLIGKNGLEAFFEQELRGKDGFRIFISGSYEKTILEEPVQNGRNLHLSLDAIAQRALYQELKEEDMTVSATDPKTGQILILLSTPSYDPNLFVSGISQANYDALIQDGRHPLAAKFAAALTPGSTQKIVSSILAFKDPAFDPFAKVDIQGKTWRLDDSWGNYEVTRYRELNGSFNLADAISNSDNIYFARLATQLGIQAFNAGMEQLGVGAEVSPDYPFSPAQISNHGPLAEKETVLLADSGYGQGELLYPPVKLCQIYAACLNGGRLLPLRLLLEEAADSPLQLLTEAQAELLRGAMARVADEQYAEQLESEKVSLSGKSGTAELGEDAAGNMRINSWFVGYEREHPSICLALTQFDSQLKEEKFYALRSFRELFETLFAKGVYTPPQPSAELKKSEEIPLWTPLVHKASDEKEGETEPTESP